MELQMKKQTLPLNEIVLDGQCEQPVECDVLLADYCPDIQRILNCDVTCLIREVRAEPQRLCIEGELRLCVLYVSDSGMLRGIDHKQPFVRHMDSKNPLRNPMTEVHCKVDYLNCRAISSRRLEVRGAVTLKVRAINCADHPAVCDCEGMGIQLKKESVSVDACLSSTESSFVLREELDLGNKQPIAQILFSKVQAVLGDFKVVSGKIVTKGDLKLTMLYAPLSADENEPPQELEYTLPISQILNADGAGDDSSCCVSYEIASWDLQPKADMDGEMKILALEATVRAVATVHQSRELVLVQDCYSTACELAQEEKQLSFLHFMGCLQEHHRIRESFAFCKNAQSVLFSWSRVKEQQCRQTEEGLVITASICLLALVLDSEGCLQLCEEVVQVEHTVPLSGEKKALIFGLQLTATSTEAVITGGGQLEFRCPLTLTGILYSMERRNAICGIQPDESRPKSRREDCALCIYYADQQESVWNIAKKYNCSVAGVMEENGLDHDILPQRTMLLIPMF